MGSSEYEILLEKFLQEKPDLTREEVEEQIRQKKEKIGAGYLTDQGALYLIASDNGISLSSISQKKHEKESSQKIDIMKLERKFSNLKHDQIKTVRLSAASSYSAMATLIAGLIFYTMISDGISSNSILSGFVTSSLGVFTAFLIIQNRNLAINRKNRIFLKFFDVYANLEKLSDSPNKDNSRKAQLSIIKLTDFIKLWTSGNYAPESISGIPEKIIKNLEKKIIPFVKIQSIPQIKKTMQLFLEFSNIVSEKEPEFNELNSLNYSLESFPKITEKELITPGIFSKKPLLKPIIIGVGFFALFFGILYSLDVETGYALAFSVTSAIALIAFIRREFSKEHSE